MKEFHNLDRDVEVSAKRWKKFTESPEEEKFPQEWKNKTSLKKICTLSYEQPGSKDTDDGSSKTASRMGIQEPMHLSD